MRTLGIRTGSVTGRNGAFRVTPASVVTESNGDRVDNEVRIGCAD